MNSQETKDYWSNESEAFSRVMSAMENGTAKLKQVENGYDDFGFPVMQLAMVAPNGNPGYDRLFLEPTGQDNVYKFRTGNQVAGGFIHGVIAADPKTGNYLPVADYTKQIQYTPGQSGGFFKNMLNDLGPIGNIALAVATGGLSIPEQLAAQTAMNVTKGQDFGDALKGAALVVGGSQLAQGMGDGSAVSGMDLAADLGVGNTLADVGSALSGSSAAATGIEALTPELNVGTAAPTVTDVSTSPVTSGSVLESTLPPATTTPAGIETLTPELNVGTASPAAPAGIEALTPELNVGTAAPAVTTMPVEYTPELNVGTSAPAVTTTPAEYTPELNVGTSAPTVTTPSVDYTPELNVGTGSSPVNESISALAPAGTAPTLNAAGIESLTGQAGYGYNAAAAEAAGALGVDAATVGAGAGVGAASVPLLKQIADATGIPEGVLATVGTGLGITALGEVLAPEAPAAASQGSYTGPLSNIKYNPATYTPYTYKPYAGGGAVEGMSNANVVGANTGYPMADIQRGSYAVPYQQPISQNVVTGGNDSRVNPYTGEEMLAGGGITNLGGYSDGGRLLRGPGDGVSDSIPAMIGNKQPARLADGEFVIPARIVSEIGNGSTDAGARKLYEMMDKVQAARRKTMGKDKFAKNTKADKYLPT
jgi:hypothetical protein